MAKTEKIKVAGYLYDATEEQYKQMKGAYNHAYYLRKQEDEAEIEVVSLDAIKESEYGGRETISDPNVDVEQEVIVNIEKERIWKILNALSDEDYYIATEYFMKSKKERKTLTEIGKVLGVSHTAVRKRRDKLKEYLSEILK